MYVYEIMSEKTYFTRLKIIIDVIVLIFFAPFWDLGVLHEKLRFQVQSKKKPTQDPKIWTKNVHYSTNKLQTTTERVLL